MLIGGLQKFSLLDYPEHLSAIIFTKGCNFRCRFCYNPMLVWPFEDSKLKYDPEKGEQKDHYSVMEDDLFDFLENRRGKLDAVVITGGEPTLHPDLPEFIAKIRKMDYKVKLDTNGTNSEMVQALINAKQVDYLAMDIKAPLEKYEKITGVRLDLDKIRESVKIIIGSGLPYEFRTTIAPGMITIEDIDKMGELLQGADLWYLQQFKSDTALVDIALEGAAGYTWKQLERMTERGGRYVKKCLVR